MKRKSAELKRMAREILNGHYGILMGTLVVSVLIQTVLLFPFELNVGANYELSRELVIYILASLVISLLGVVLSAGIIKISLALSRGQSYKFTDMFYGFTHHPDKYILATLLLAVICLIPAVPVIILSILIGMYASDVVFAVCMVILMIAMIVAEFAITLTYTLVYFLLIDHSDMKVREAFRKSKELMKGNKGRMLYLILSFIGLGILGALSCGIGYLWIQPYMMQTQVQFYLDVTGELDERARAAQEAYQAKVDAGEQVEPVRSYFDKCNSALETASLIVGICGIVTACCGYTAIMLGALAIILAMLSRGGEMQLSGKAVTGLVVGIISVLIGIIILVVAFAYVINIYGGIDGYMNSYNEILNQYMQ